MSEKKPIDFAAAAKRLREQRGSTSSREPEHREFQREAEPVVVDFPNAPSVQVAEGDSTRVFDRRIDPAAFKDFTLRTFARLLGVRASNEHLINTFARNSEEEEQKYIHLVAMEKTLKELDGQILRKEQNVALRRSAMRSAGTDDLIKQFYGSNEHDWTARPSTYIALLDELEERGFFALSTKEDDGKIDR